MDDKILGWFISDCINASMDLAQGMMAVRGNDSAEANDPKYIIIEGIKCLFIYHFNKVRN